MKLPQIGSLLFLAACGVHHAVAGTTFERGTMYSGSRVSVSDSERGSWSLRVGTHHVYLEFDGRAVTLGGYGGAVRYERLHPFLAHYRLHKDGLPVVMWREYRLRVGDELIDLSQREKGGEPLQVRQR